MTGLRELRFLVLHEGRLRKLAKVFFTAGDASFYIVPYARKGLYYFGRSAFPVGETRITHNFTTQHLSKAPRIPRLSLHASRRSRVHVDGRTIAGPLVGPPLATLRGEHVATILADAFEGLMEFDDGRAFRVDW